MTDPDAAAADTDLRSPPETLDELRQRVSAAVQRADRLVDAGPYEPEWPSLEEHEAAPEWFRDAKFGIYCHWGVYSVPAFNSEWYPRWMYMSDPEEIDVDWGNEVYPHHVETYGEPEEFPYQAFVPEFTAEHFDPEAWADLFANAGAGFAGLSAEHHDGFSNWASAVNPWNAGARGPERDLVGELGAAIRDRGLRLYASFHHSRTREYYEFAARDYPSVTEGFPDQVMYGNVEEELFIDLWLAKIVEVIDAYGPDVIGHDAELPTIPEAHRRRYLAYSFTAAAAEDRDVVVTAKDHELPPSVAVESFERGRPGETRERPWITGTSVTTGGWSYTGDADLRSARELVHELIDVVSKNGCYLLNVAPRADGRIPEAQREILREVGAWLDTHGEAIYGTRPWATFGHGPTSIGEGGHFVDDVEYTSEDVRYTRAADGETVYAIVTGWPQRAVVLEGVEVSGAGREAGADADDAPTGTVELLGSDAPVETAVTDDGHLELSVPDLAPDERPSEIAVAFAVTGFGVTDAASPE